MQHAYAWSSITLPIEHSIFGALNGCEAGRYPYMRACEPQMRIDGHTHHNEIKSMAWNKGVWLVKWFITKSTEYANDVACLSLPSNIQRDGTHSSNWNWHNYFVCVNKSFSFAAKRNVFTD